MAKIPDKFSGDELKTTDMRSLCPHLCIESCSVGSTIEEVKRTDYLGNDCSVKTKVRHTITMQFACKKSYGGNIYRDFPQGCVARKAPFSGSKAFAFQPYGATEWRVTSLTNQKGGDQGSGDTYNVVLEEWCPDGATAPLTAPLTAPEGDAAKDTAPEGDAKAKDKKKA